MMTYTIKTAQVTQEAAVRRALKHYRPESPNRRFNEFTKLFSILVALWLVCLGIQTGWSWMLSNATFYAPDPVLAAAYKAQLDHNNAIGEHYQYLTLPYDGRTEPCHIKGSLASTSDLPTAGNKNYDSYIIGHHIWVWAVPKAGGTIQWIDP